MGRRSGRAPWRRRGPGPATQAPARAALPQCLSDLVQRQRFDERAAVVADAQLLLPFIAVSLLVAIELPEPACHAESQIIAKQRIPRAMAFAVSSPKRPHNPVSVATVGLAPSA